MDRGTEGMDPARRRRRRSEDPMAAGTPHRIAAEDDAARNGGVPRWGAIWAGALAALLLFLLLDFLVFGIGLTSASDRPGDTGSEDWVSGIVGLIAFFVGGYLATGPLVVASLRESRAALIEGLLVWALGSLVLITLSALGMGQFFGALGDIIGQSLALGDPSTIIEPSQLTNTIKSSALGAFLSLVVWAIASGVGSSLGSRS